MFTHMPFCVANSSGKKKINGIYKLHGECINNQNSSLSDYAHIIILLTVGSIINHAHTINIKVNHMHH